MKSGCSGDLKPDKLGLSCKANNCIDAGTGDLGVLTTHEILSCFSLGDAGSTHPGGMTSQVKVHVNKLAHSVNVLGDEYAKKRQAN